MNKLSKKAVDLLDYNGYSYRNKAGIVSFRKQFDYVGPSILLFLSLFITAVFPPIGLVVLLICIIGVYSYWSSKKGKRYAFDTNVGRAFILKRRILFRHVEGFYLRSKFVSEYSSAHKSTSQEYKVTLGIELTRGERYEMFSFIADHEKPSKEVEEIHDYLKDILRNSKK